MISMSTISSSLGEGCVQRLPDANAALYARTLINEVLANHARKDVGSHASRPRIAGEASPSFGVIRDLRAAFARRRTSRRGRLRAASG